MIPHRDKLEILARDYVTFLTQRHMDLIKPHLSLNFVARQTATEQLKMICKLPQLIFGFGLEIHLFDQYETEQKNSQSIISPFQFQVSYSLHMNLIELENTTITIHAVVQEQNTWKIASVISDKEQDILQNVIESFEAKTKSS